MPSLPYINVVFNESVRGVNAADLLINSTPASSGVTNNPNDFTFYFSESLTGHVAVTWGKRRDYGCERPGQSLRRHQRLGLQRGPNDSRAISAISELMAANANGIRDEMGTTADWIEVGNFGTVQGSLAGYFLTTPANLRNGASRRRW